MYAFTKTQWFGGVSDHFHCTVDPTAVKAFSLVRPNFQYFIKNELRPTRVCFCIETTKNVSGKPSNFERVAHVGFNSTAGFNLDNVDPKILKFFEKVKLVSSPL